MNAVALIPAKSTSQRIPDKNIRPLAGHPLMAYSIAAAKNSGVFQDVYVSTDSREYAKIAREYGAKVVMRPVALAKPDSVDYAWVDFTLRWLYDEVHRYDAFAILRPTSPFRMPETIHKAWLTFANEVPSIDSLRAVERVTQHPGKMWSVFGDRMHPLIPFYDENLIPWHSCQTQSLPDVYIQNASLEFAWVDTVWRTKTIAGDAVMPYFMPKNEGMDINTKWDWAMALLMVRAGVPLPEVV
jgi:CMP-N-acetylneuraminic acid synthetase